VDGVHEAARVAGRRHLADPDIGMREQEAEEFTAHVPAPADDRGGDGGGRHAGDTAAVSATSTTYETISSGMFTPVTAMLFRNSIV